MSSILKALKKLEEEQADRSVDSPGRSGGQFVAPPPARRRPLLLVSVSIGIGLLLVGGYYLLAGRPDTSLTIRSPMQHSPASEPAASTIAASPSARPGSPVAAAGQTAKAPGSPVVIVKPPVSTTWSTAIGSSRTTPAATSAFSLPVAQGPATLVRTGAAGSKPAPPSNQPVVVSPVPAAVPVEQVQVERHEIPSPGRQWAAPHLVVSEILPVSGGARMAIINGLPVMEGTMVEDALVKEVRAGQVIFEIDGKRVVVPLSPP